MNLKKSATIIQLLVLGSGMIFAWFTVIRELINFYATEGTILKIADSLYRNPVVTPCFYGAVGFVVILIWAFYIWREFDESKKILYRKWHTLLLLGGTLFAWSIVGWEWWQIEQAAGVPVVGCSGLMNSIFDSTCLYGALFYTFSLGIGFYLYKDAKKSNKIHST